MHDLSVPHCAVPSVSFCTCILNCVTDWHRSGNFLVGNYMSFSFSVCFYLRFKHTFDSNTHALLNSVILMCLILVFTYDRKMA